MAASLLGSAVSAVGGRAPPVAATAAQLTQDQHRDVQSACQRSSQTRVGSHQHVLNERTAHVGTACGRHPTLRSELRGRPDSFAGQALKKSLVSSRGIAYDNCNKLHPPSPQPIPSGLSAC